jgi:hypothetical protein
MIGECVTPRRDPVGDIWMTHAPGTPPTIDDTARIQARFRRGGMAEWSMAVGLENVDDRLYQDGYIFPPNIT